MSRSFPHPTAESVAMPQGFGERILRSAITTLALSNNYVPWDDPSLVREEQEERHETHARPQSLWMWVAAKCHHMRTTRAETPHVFIVTNNTDVFER